MTLTNSSLTYGGFEPFFLHSCLLRADRTVVLNASVAESTFGAFITPDQSSAPRSFRYASWLKLLKNLVLIKRGGAFFDLKALWMITKECSLKPNSTTSQLFISLLFVMIKSMSVAGVCVVRVRDLSCCVRFFALKRSFPFYH